MLSVENGLEVSKTEERKQRGVTVVFLTKYDGGLVQDGGCGESHSYMSLKELVTLAIILMLLKRRGGRRSPE